MKALNLIFWSFIFCSVIYSQSSSQIIGQFPDMDGGFQSQRTGNLRVKSISSGDTSLTWTTTSSSGMNTIQNSGGRTGANFLRIDLASGASQKVIQSRSVLRNGANDTARGIANLHPYIIQFYYRTLSSTTPSQNKQVCLYSDGSYSPSLDSLKLSSTNGVWKKFTRKLIAATSNQMPRYGVAGIKFLEQDTVDIDIDDLVVYDGTVPDTTAPSPVLNAITSGISSSQITLRWQIPSNGIEKGGYIIIRSTTNSNPTLTVNAVYTKGDNLPSGEKIVYLGTDTLFADTGLQSSTTYYYWIYTADKAFNYSVPVPITAATLQTGLASEPTIQASNITFVNTTSTSAIIQMAKGNGSGRLILVRENFSVDTIPADGQSYSSNAIFGTGAQIGAGNYVVYSGIDSSVQVTNLKKATQYYVKVFEYNGSGNSTNYYTYNAPGSGVMTKPGTAYSNGIGGGNWSATSAWNGGTVPDQADSVIILNGDIITLTNDALCYSITVNSGGALRANGSYIDNPRYLSVFGKYISNSGSFGQGNDGLSIKCKNTVTVAGSGTYALGKIKPGIQHSALTIQSDITLNFRTDISTESAGLLLSAFDEITNSYCIFDSVVLAQNKKITLSNLTNIQSSENVNTADTVISALKLYGKLISGDTLSGILLSPSRDSAVTVICDDSIYVNNLRIGLSGASGAANVSILSNGVIIAGKGSRGVCDLSNSHSIFTGAGKFEIYYGAYCLLGSSSGLNPVSGPIRCDTRVFSIGAQYEFNGSAAQSTGNEFPSSATAVKINNAAGISLSQNLRITRECMLTNGDFNSSSYSLSYDSTARLIYNSQTLSQVINSAAFPAVSPPGTLIINNPNGVSLSLSRVIDDTLSLLNGKLNVQNATLTLNASTIISGVLSSSRYIQLNSGASLKKLIGVNSYFLPIGNAAGFSPVEIQINSGTFNQSALTFAVSAGKHSSNLSHTNYLLRYWGVTLNNVSSINYDLNCYYNSIDAHGASSQLVGGRWYQNKWCAGQYADTTLKKLAFINLNSGGDFTAGENDFMGNSALLKLFVIPEGLYNPLTNLLRMQDTVTVFLHTAASPFPIADTARATINLLTFESDLAFDNILSGNYYLAVKHRNSIETWSDTIYSFSRGCISNFDLTSDSSRAYGSNLIKAGTKWCVYSGDVNNDGIVDFSDMSAIDNASFNYCVGYVPEDLSGDNFVDFTDLTIADNNSFKYIVVIKPSGALPLSKPKHRRH